MTRANQHNPLRELALFHYNAFLSVPTDSALEEVLCPLCEKYHRMGMNGPEIVRWVRKDLENDGFHEYGFR